MEFQNVHFAYPARPEVPVFQDFSLSIPSGSVTALVGPSGSGKSTVVSLLLRLYDPVSGTFSLDGYDIRQLNPAWLRSKIGTVSQVGGVGPLFTMLSVKISFVICFLISHQSLKRGGTQVFPVH